MKNDDILKNLDLTVETPCGKSVKVEVGWFKIFLISAGEFF